MGLFGKLHSIGLDIGQANTKVVVLEKTRDGVELVSSGIFHNREEGILNDTELAEHLADWLRDFGARTHPVTIGIPQYMTTAQISDFPPSKGQQLDEMVEYETRHLAGLSDDAFIYDYHALSAFGEFKNPILIGICREAVVHQRVDMMADTGAAVNDLAMNGLALVNAFLEGTPDTHGTGTELLLDIGSDNTTYVILRGGEINGLGSIPMGGDTFTETLARALSIPVTDAESTKLESHVQAGDEESPLTRTAVRFEKELRIALEQWMQQQGDYTALDIEAIHLSGGGSLLNGFAEYLGHAFGCNIDPMTLKVATSKDAAPVHFNVAYGLALQGITESKVPVPVSLSTADIAWGRLRGRRLSYLAASLAILVTLMIAGLFGFRQHLITEQKNLERDMRTLEQCATLIDRIDAKRAELDAYQAMLIPFASRGNRNGTIMKAIAALGERQPTTDFLVYLGDEKSFFDERPMLRYTYSAGTAPRDADILGTESRQPKYVVQTNQLKSWTRLFAAGCTPERPEDRIGTITRTVLALNDTGSPFTNVDTIPGAGAHVNSILAPWAIEHKMNSYRLHLPLANVSFDNGKMK